MSADVPLLIAGAARPGRAGWLDVIDPATEQLIGRVAAAGVLDVDDAVASAVADFPAWANRPAHERGDVLKRAAARLAERAGDVARTLAAESGKTLPEAAAEVGRAVETLAWNGEQAGRVEGRALPGKTAGAQRLSLPTPVGVVAAFAAWNFPAVLAARKLGAILAAGCTAILKAAEPTPGTAAEVVRALAEAGAPVNLLFGDPAAISRQLLGAPEVRAVTFTGSTRVGRIIAGLAAQGLKRTVLELGGHAPVIVAADADLDLAVTATLPAKFGSAGQSCVAPSRYLVHASLYDEFTARFTAAAQAQAIGPVISPDRLDALAALTRDAVAKGAELRCGGERAPRRGYFWPPTVLANVPAEAEVMREEPFGPLAVINPFDTLQQAITAANATEYAFAAYLFTDSLATRRAVLRDLRASNLGINQMAPSLPDAPLGGMQDSGVGYEGGRDGIAAFQHLRLVSETAAP